MRRESWILGFRVFNLFLIIVVLFLLILYLGKKFYKRVIIGVKSNVLDMRNFWVKYLYMLINWIFYNFNYLEI